MNVFFYVFVAIRIFLRPNLCTRYAYNYNVFPFLTAFQYLTLNSLYIYLWICLIRVTWLLSSCNLKILINRLCWVNIRLVDIRRLNSLHLNFARPPVDKSIIIETRSSTFLTMVERNVEIKGVISRFQFQSASRWRKHDSVIFDMKMLCKW